MTSVRWISIQRLRCINFPPIVCQLFSISFSIHSTPKDFCFHFYFYFLVFLFCFLFGYIAVLSFRFLVSAWHLAVPLLHSPLYCEKSLFLSLHSKPCNRSKFNSVWNSSKNITVCVKSFNFYCFILLKFCSFIWLKCCWSKQIYFFCKFVIFFYQFFGLLLFHCDWISLPIINLFDCRENYFFGN